MEELDLADGDGLMGEESPPGLEKSSVKTSGKEPSSGKSSVKKSGKAPDSEKSSVKTSGKELSSEKSSVKTGEKILSLVRENRQMTIPEMAERLGITTRGVEKQVAKLQEQGRLRRIGPAKGGHWEVIE